MGDRGQVEFIQSDGTVWFYTHWTASELVDTVRSALAREERWGDEEYLARIVFAEMTKGDEGSATGYGIGLSQHDDAWRVVMIDATKQTVAVRDNHGGEFLDPVSFTAFVQNGVQLLAEATRENDGQATHPD